MPTAPPALLAFGTAPPMPRRPPARPILLAVLVAALALVALAWALTLVAPLRDRTPAHPRTAFSAPATPTPKVGP